jgi:hypothetical protein
MEGKKNLSSMDLAMGVLWKEGERGILVRYNKRKGPRASSPS